MGPAAKSLLMNRAARRLPPDLRLLRVAFRLLPLSHRVARYLWSRRLSSMGVVAAPTRYGFTILVEPAGYHGWSLAVHGTHEPENTALLLAHLEPDDVFADVGANYGWFSLLAASQLRTMGGRVVAFEPQGRLAALLRQSAELNALDNLAVLEVAVGDEAGCLPLYPGKAAHSEYASLAPEGIARETVRVITLDECFRDMAPSIVKVDVEGFELRVLLGATRLLAGHAPRMLLLEVHPPLMARLGDQPGDLVHVLKQSGYRLYYLPMSLRGMRVPRLVELTESHLAAPCFNLVALRE